MSKADVKPIPQAARGSRGEVERTSADAYAAVADALRMLFDLLEAYAPPWYTQEHHNKASTAIALLNGYSPEDECDSAPSYPSKARNVR